MNICKWNCLIFFYLCDKEIRYRKIIQTFVLNILVMDQCMRLYSDNKIIEF